MAFENIYPLVMMILGGIFGYMLIQSDEEETTKPVSYGRGQRLLGGGDR